MFRSGINLWRDSRKPKEILEDYCKKNRLTGPMYYGNNSVKVGQRVFALSEFGEHSVRFSSVQDGTYAEYRKSPYALHPVSQKFPQHHL